MFRIKKVLAYVIQSGKLLIIEHVDFPQCGWQIPGGTVEIGETLEDAVVREVFEETGLKKLVILTKLGIRDFQKDLNTIHERHFYIVQSTDKTSDSWRWNETHPSEGDQEIIRFNISWKLLDVVEFLADEHDYFLHEVKKFLWDNAKALKQ